MDTQITVRRLNPCSAYCGGSYWQAELTENGARVWPDCVARSYISEDDARRLLLLKIEGKTTEGSQ